MPVQYSGKSFSVDRTPFLVYRARGAIENAIAQYTGKHDQMHSFTPRKLFFVSEPLGMADEPCESVCYLASFVASKTAAMQSVTAYTDIDSAGGLIFGRFYVERGRNSGLANGVMFLSQE